MQAAVPLGEGSMIALMPIDLPTAQAVATKYVLILPLYSSS